MSLANRIGSFFCVTEMTRRDYLRRVFLFYDRPSTSSMSRLVVLRHVDMLEIILYYFSLVFPRTFGRLVHWHSLLFYDNKVLLESWYMILTILPSCIYLLHGHIAARQFRDDDVDERPLNDRPGPSCTMCLIW